MKKIKGAVAVMLLAAVTLSATGCAVSLFTSEHKHYHRGECDKCKKHDKEKCSDKCSTEILLKQ